VERINLPAFAPTDVIVTFAFTNGLDYEPRSCVKDDTDTYDIVAPGIRTAPEGEQLRLGGISCIERTYLRTAIEQLLTGAHVAYAVTREVRERSKTVRKTYFDLKMGPTATEREATLNAELLRFAERSLWSIEVYRNPRKDAHGKTALHIRCFARVPFKNAVGEVPMVWPRDARGNPIKDAGKVPMEPDYVLMLDVAAKYVAATPAMESAEAAA